MLKQVLLTGLIFGIVAIVLGAFGAHGLKKFLNTEQLISFETGVRYLMYHAFFLLFVGLMSHNLDIDVKSVYWLILLGVILFSGSIFLLTTESITGFSIKKFAFITPIGGLLLIIGWGFMLVKVYKSFN